MFRRIISTLRSEWPSVSRSDSSKLTWAYSRIAYYNSKVDDINLQYLGSDIPEYDFDRIRSFARMTLDSIEDYEEVPERVRKEFDERDCVGSQFKVSQIKQRMQRILEQS